MSDCPTVRTYCAGARRPEHRLSLKSALLGAMLGLVALCPAPSIAGEPPLPMEPLVSDAPANAPSFWLGTWTSRPGEAKDDFVRRVAVPMAEFTRATDFEVCATLNRERAGSRYRVSVTTNRSHIGCMHVSWEDPEFEETGETIHTHPRLDVVAVNQADAALFPRSGLTPRTGRLGVQPGSFSATDYHAGPGYVVAQRGNPFWYARLLHQTGEGTEENLGRLPELSAADLASDAVLPSERLAVRRHGGVPAALAATATPQDTLPEEKSAPSRLRAPGR